MVRALGLRMGILDLKLGPDGELVWLEINPQGQFTFLEGDGEWNSSLAPILRLPPRRGADEPAALIATR